MSTKYLKITNTAENVSRIALEKLGLSTKRNDPNTIGQFGSGIKFAPIAALRNGWEWWFTGNDNTGPFVMQYVKQHVPDPRKAPLAGSSVYVDRGFLARDLPELDEHLHYRVIDVSSIKELARRWYPKVYFSSPEKTGNHRALADIRESIAELRYYREAIMVAQPGPGSDIAKELANRFVVEHE
jgi:hypothetical protein